MAKQVTDKAPRPPRRWRRWLAAGAGILLVPIALLAWLILTEMGLHSVAALLPWMTDGQVSLEGVSGRVAGRLRVERLQMKTPDMQIQVRDISLDWQPSALLSRRIEVDTLSVSSVDLTTRPDEKKTTDSGALKPPPAFTLPFSVSVHRLALGRFSLHKWDTLEADGSTGGHEPVFEAREFSTTLSSDGRHHRIDGLSIESSYGVLALNAAFDSGASPFVLSADAAFKGRYEERDFNVQLVAKGDLLAPHLTMQAESAGVKGEGDVLAAPFETMPLRQIKLTLGEVDPSAFHPSAPHAALTAELELTPQSEEDWVLGGPVKITNRLPESHDKNGVPVTEISAQITWSQALTRVEDLVIAFAGDGKLSGHLDWQPQAATQDGQPSAVGLITAKLALAGIQVQEIDTRLPAAQVDGQVEADGNALHQTARLDLKAGLAHIQAEGAFSPANKMQAASFSAKGMLAHINPAAFVANAPEAELNLSFDSHGSLTEQPSIQASWIFEPSTINKLALNGKGEVDIQESRIEKTDIHVEIAENSLNARGAWGRTGDTLNIALDAPALEKLGYGLSGKLALQGNVSGTLEAPSGHVQAEASTLQLPGEIRIGSLSLQGQADHGLDGSIQLRLAVNGLGKSDAPAWVENIALLIDGKAAGHEISATATTPDGDALHLKLAGALQLPHRDKNKENKEAQAALWQGKLTTLESEGRLVLQLSEPVALTASAEKAELASARLNAGKQGNITLTQTRWTPQETIAKGALSGLVIDLRQRRRGKGPEPLSLGATWDVRLNKQAQAQIHLFREAGDLFIPGDMPVRIALDQLDAKVALQNGRINTQADIRGKNIGTLSATLAAPLENSPEHGWRLTPTGALQGEARLDMPSISWLSRIQEQNIDLGGSLSALFTLNGTVADPQVSGKLEGNDLAVALLDEGLRLSGGKLLAEADRTHLKLTELSFVSPNRVTPNTKLVPLDELTQTPGTLDVIGELAFDSGVGAFDFKVDRLPLLQRTDRWLVLSGSGKADIARQSADLNAKFQVDAGYIELGESAPPSLSNDVVVLGKDDSNAQSSTKIRAKITVLLGENLYLSAMGLQTRLAGGMGLSMKEDQPLSAVGIVKTVDGVFKGYGQNLTLERGLINFQGPIDNPGLNIVALRKGLAVEAGIEVSGSARRPHIKLVSNPEVPDVDKLSWIVLGHASAGSSGADLGALLPAAQALLGGSSGGGGGITGQLADGLGLDQVGIGQGESNSVNRTASSRVVGTGSSVSGGEASSGQALMLGKRLSPDMFLSFEQSLGGASTLLKFTYQLSRRVSLVARGGTDTSTDVYYTVSFR